MERKTFLITMALLFLSAVPVSAADGDIGLSSLMGDSSPLGALDPIKAPVGFLVALVIVFFMLAAVGGVFMGGITSSMGGMLNRVELKSHGTGAMFNAVGIVVLAALALIILFYFANSYLL